MSERLTDAQISSERERFEAAFKGDFQRDAVKPDEYWNTPTQCAWKGWQLAKAEAAERERALVADLDQAERSRDFYKRRCEQLQSVQSLMRDPERQAVCEILANGCGTDALADGHAEREAALAAEVERLREAGRAALAYLEGCDGLAVAVPIGMLRAALAQHESKEANDE